IIFHVMLHGGYFEYWKAGLVVVEEGIDYKDVFAPVARIEAIRLFLAYASFMRFTVYQMDVKSAFLYDTIDEEVYMMQPPGFQDLQFPDRVYKVEKEMYGLRQAPRAWYGTLSKYLLANGFQIDVRSANTPIDKENPWGKDGPGKDVELHLYRSTIGSLMYLTASRPGIMFTICACARHQVTPKECHLHAIKRIFRYLKTIVATSTTEAEYVAAASGCGQVLWIQIRCWIMGLNEFSSNIATAVGEGLGTPTEERQSPHHDPSSSSSHPTATTESISTATPTEIPTLR
nr:retrovirus-related Pol polyprotein from transposon TNT 1-94 [Tanacetum cinerariifolium]